jgi:hypothetical protein
MKALVITNDSTVFRYEEASAEEMFGGRVTEVRNLKNRLSEICDVSFGMISGKYGFIPGDRVITRYENVPDSAAEYKRLQERTDFSAWISMISERFDAVLIFVPKEMMRLIIEEDVECKVISSTSPKFKREFERRGWKFFERKGARVGKKNADDIVKLISSSYF